LYWHSVQPRPQSRGRVLLDAVHSNPRRKRPNEKVGRLKLLAPLGRGIGRRGRIAPSGGGIVIVAPIQDIVVAEMPVHATVGQSTIVGQRAVTAQDVREVIVIEKRKWSRVPDVHARK